MYKFVVLSILALGCSARSYSTYGGASYGGYGAQTVLAPQKVALVGSSYGSGSYGSSGLVSLGGYGSGFGAGYGANYGSGLAFNGGLVRSGHVLGSSGLNFGQTSGLALGASSFGVANNNFGLLSVRQSQQIEPVVPAAIQQVARTVEYRPFANVEQPIQPQVIEVEPSDNPIHLHFKTRSSTLTASQSHTPAAPQEVQTASAQDEPSRLITEVQKPIIQEVREVIHPYRQVTQEINPVQESLHQIVTKGEGQRAQYSGAQIGAQYGAQYAVANKFAVAQPAAIAVQSAYAAPAIQASYVAQPAALQTSYVSQPALQTSYVSQPAAFQTSYVSQPAVQTSYQSTYSAAKPIAIQSSSFQVKPIKTESSYSSSSSVAADGY